MISTYLLFYFHFFISFYDSVSDSILPCIIVCWHILLCRDRFESIGTEGELIVEEGETKSRQAASEIRVLRSNTGEK